MNEKQSPRGTFDEPIDLSPEEIAVVAKAVNLLLKCPYLLGATSDIEGMFQSIADIAEEVAGVDCASYVSLSDAGEFRIVASRGISLPIEQDDAMFEPVARARTLDKVLLLDGEGEALFLPLCRSWGSRSLAVFPLRREREFIGALLFGKDRTHPFTTSQVKLLWVLAHHAESLRMRNEAVWALSIYSFLDPLTHLYNRRYFDDQIDKEIFRSRRSGKSFSLLMLDLDGFKSYNDRFLQSAGDVALQEIAAILQDTVREVDTVARIGGDDFALVLVDSVALGARDLADRMVERIGRHLLPGPEGVRTERLSASVGIAAFPADSFEKQDLVRKADRALYLAKSQGGGKVCLFHEIADVLAVKPSAADLPIQKIYQAARSVVDMDRFLEILLFTAMQGLSSRRGSIVLLGPEGSFTIRAAVGFGNGEERFAPGTAIVPGDVTSWVLERKEPLVVAGPEDLPFTKTLRKNGYRGDTFLAIPLAHEGTLLGVLHLTNRVDGKPYTKEDVAVFDPIAKEISAILSQGIDFRENARKFSTTILQSLSSALELRFSFLAGHARRVEALATKVAGRLGMSAAEISSLSTAARIHDIGLIGIPGSILWKKRKLTSQEIEVARKHPYLGAKLLEGVPGMEDTRRIVLEHQEFYDGSGYPYGLRGEEISRGARILSLAEFFDSITSERPHRGALHPEEAAQIVRNSMGRLFDEEVCRAFLDQRESSPP